MKLESTQMLPVGQADAWAALNDTDLLQRAIPGCESMLPDGPDRFALVVAAAIGPVKARFKGRLDLLDRDPPRAYTIHFEGQGGAAGHGKGTASIRLEAIDAQQTLLHYSATAQVGGKIAQLGARLVDMAAQKMAQDFFQRFDAALRERQAASAPPVPQPATDAAAGPVAGLWARLLAWLTGLRGLRGSQRAGKPG